MPVFLAWAAYTLAAWGQNPSLQKTRSGEGMAALPLAPSSWQASGRCSRSGWFQFLVSMDLSDGFGLGCRPREEVLPYKIKEIQESVCTLQPTLPTNE